MKHYTYLIVGGGMAADAAVRGIREEDSNGTIAVLSRDTSPPYQRPPLSKALWTKDQTPDDIDCGTASQGADVFTGRTVQAVRPDDKTVSDQEETYRYDKLLLATGGSPNRLPFEPADRAVYYRTLDDFRTVKDLAETTDRFAVIGGSFIGCEMAAALLANGKKVSVIFPEEAPFRRLFPKKVSMDLLRLFEEQGAEMIPGVKLSDLHCDSEECRLVLESGQLMNAGAVIIGIGIKPNTDLAESAGLKTGDGIEASRQLQTSDPDIYAAGDVVRFYNPALDQMLRVEHEDHAVQSGKLAGQNMAGKSLEYDHLPSFYSDLFEQSCEAVGVLDSSLQTEGIWTGVREKGIWVYLKNRRVCGVLLWNLSGKMDLAKALIAEPEPLEPKALKLRLGTFLAEENEE